MKLHTDDALAKLAMPARWLMVAAIAYTLATSALYFVSPPTTDPGDTRTAPASPERRAQVDVNAIIASNLFGAAEPGAGDTGPASTPAVATQLPLELQGVFVADDPDNSAAIIAQRGRQGMLYELGEDVPGNATLVEVNQNHVVLRRAGVRETLHFPASGEGLAARTLPPDDTGPEPAFDEMRGDPYAEEGYDVGDVADDQAPPDAGLEEEDMSEMLDAYREQIEEDPAQAMEELGVEPVSEGAAEGYRVGDLARSPYLSQTGLQPGDVILSVNGRPVGDLNQDRMELANVLAQGSARLEVQRGARRFYVTASLPDQ